ncbi:MAG: hypothetical protein COB96_03875, partial [Planctomycetota bacterium]
LAAFRLGAGRTREGQELHPGVGVKMLVKNADKVSAGQPLAVLHHQQGHGLEEARMLLAKGILIS